MYQAHELTKLAAALIFLKKKASSADLLIQKMQRGE
jgi:hypothetical protein